MKRKPMFVSLFQEMWDVFFPKKEEEEKQRKAISEKLEIRATSYLDQNEYKEDELKYKREDDE